MYRSERIRIISELLEKNGRVNINDLSKMFFVSEMTIRRDLTALENQGLV
jgi:DeoR/GlpR family transcriptional regulator of sugar metabolism